MTSFDHMLPPTERMPYTIITPQYSPHTTVAISLRHFEKQSKHQAEQEYDDEHGMLPETAADDDLSIDIQERTIQKKKRKVRSAIVSRRKNAIYEKKLEEELHHRDQVNADLRARLALFHDVLDNIREKISALERSVHSKQRDAQVASGLGASGLGAAVSQVAPHVLRRARPAVNGSMFPMAQQMLSQQQTQQNMFFLQNEDRLVEDVLNGTQGKQLSSFPEVDFSSECSDRQISPVIPPSTAERCVSSVADVGAMGAMGAMGALGGEDAFGVDHRMGAAAMLAAPSFVV